MSWLIGRVLFAARPHDHAVGDHPSGTTVAGRLVRSTRTLGRAALRHARTALRGGRLLDLAPGGVYRATTVTRRAGGLLQLRVTLTAAGAAAVCSLWHCPAGCPGWVLPTTSPCGARTFLDAHPEVYAAAARPAHPRRQGYRRSRHTPSHRPTASQASRVRPAESRQPSHGDVDEHRRRDRTAEDARQRPHVAVVAAGRRHDVSVADRLVVGRVEAAPAVVPPLHPRVRLALDGLPDHRVDARVQVARDIARRDAQGAQRPDDQVRDVLADPGPLDPC